MVDESAQLRTHKVTKIGPKPSRLTLESEVILIKLLVALDAVPSRECERVLGHGVELTLRF